MVRMGKAGLGPVPAARPASWAAGSWPPTGLGPSEGVAGGCVSPARSLSRVSCGTLQPQPFMPEKLVSRQVGLKPNVCGSKGR